MTLQELTTYFSVLTSSPPLFFCPPNMPHHVFLNCPFGFQHRLSTCNSYQPYYTQCWMLSCPLTITFNMSAICHWSQTYLLLQNKMEQGTGFHALCDGLYQIVGYPSNGSIPLSTSMNSQEQIVIDPNTFAYAQSALNMPLNNIILFSSTYMFHPLISNPYCNPYQDAQYFQTQIPPHYTGG